MLRPSAFQNNGSAETASSSKSILRPSSFQLAPSTLSTANNSNNKSECSNEPSTTSHSDSPFELKEEKQSTSTSNESTKEDDSKISSTTNNDGDNNGENSDETKVIPNPFNNSKVKGTEHDEDDDETDSASKPSDDDKSKQQPTQEKKPDLLDGSNLFAANTKSLFASAASKSPFLAANNGSESSFVFGQNIHERIVGVPDTSVSSASSSADDNHSDSSSGSKLFAVSSASTSEATSAGGGSGGTGGGGGSTNGAEPKESSTVEDLTKVAREYEESRAQKRKLDAVETFTGEEDEVNVVDMSSRLFAFVASNYEQRGPGSLRLNDVKTDDARSRVVFRTLGNFRVLLNTKVWGGMIVEKPSQKSLRFTAIDSNDGAVKIYLVMARPDDINTLYSALKKRIEIERKREKTEESTSASSSSANDEANTSKDSHHETDEQPDAKKDRKS
ncbi:ran-binding protein 3 [Contarinia nasturtii]|uniref:ran-binding protein 3 n=1 Tax=Contarinia nasturtii TaxID=265458 RepID=UPI0012D47754|nr:ran-binding protein 3 [Contarinia nasturtii]